MTRRASTLIVPVENQIRELDAKLLLACVAAERGFPVVLGSRAFIHHQIASFPRGVYLAKSMRSLMVALGFMWARMAALALPRVNGPEGAFYRAKVGTARFYLHRILPHSAALGDVIRSTDDSLLDFDDDAF